MSKTNYKWLLLLIDQASEASDGLQIRLGQTTSLCMYVLYISKSQYGFDLIPNFINFLPHIHCYLGNGSDNLDQILRLDNFSLFKFIYIWLLPEKKAI